MVFRIRDDILIRARSIRTNKIENYSSNDLSRAISFFLDKINSVKDSDDKTISVIFGNLSFLSMAFVFALIKSQRDYTVIYYQGDDIPDHSDLKTSKLFLAGCFKNNQDINLEQQNPDVYVRTENLEFETQALNYHSQVDLNFEFGLNTKIYSFNRQAGNERLLNHSTGKIEASSTQAAMDNYYEDNDHCVFVRPLKHIGVATLAVYPAFFKAQAISLCNYREDWEEEYTKATHVHVSQVVITEKWPLPKKLRILTTGGFPFLQQYVDQVKSMSDVDDIIDCYGTSTCPPPLAIRSLLNAPAYLNTGGVVPFKWINKYIKFVNKGDMLYFTTDDADTFNGVIKEVNGEIFTGDKIETVGTEEFILYGNPYANFIRMEHVLWRLEKFEEFFKQEMGFDITIAIYTKEKFKIPVILATKENIDSIKSFVVKYDVEASIYVKHD